MWVVATVRSEFLSTAPDRAGLAEAIDDPLVIEPLSRARLAEVIARPGPAGWPGVRPRAGRADGGGHRRRGRAAAAGLHPARAVPASRTRGADQRWPTTTPSAASSGALRHRADRLAEELGRRGHGRAGGAHPAPAGHGDRRRTSRPAAGSAAARSAPRAGGGGRLRRRPPADQPIRRLHGQTHRRAGREATVEVAHEALLRQWPPLRDAIEADRDLLRLRSELERLAADWQQGQRDDSYLLRGGRLAAHRPVGRPSTAASWARSNASSWRPAERWRRASWRPPAGPTDACARSPAAWRVLLVAALVASGLAWRSRSQTGPGADPASAVPAAGRSRRTGWSTPSRTWRILARPAKPEPGPRPAPGPSAGLIDRAGPDHPRVPTADRPHRLGAWGGVQPGRAAAGHRQPGSDGAAVGCGHRPTPRRRR